ncbi:MAG: SurA N-terminal domain-containing protein, partial [Pseudomonadota bacterium]|nr:SurA N-terminal domain-containing protein [Pseudomonadota bacterium]
MFDSIREGKAGKLFTYIIFGLIIVSFSLWGVESYVNNIGRSSGVAKVDGRNISQEEFNVAFRNQMDQMREMLGQNYDPALIDNPQARANVLAGMVNRQLLADAARKVGLVVTDEQLYKIIEQIPAFRENDKFSPTRFQTYARNRGMTGVMIEEQIRQDNLLQQMRDAITTTAIVPKFQVAGFVKLSEQQREVSQAIIAPSMFADQAKVDEKAAKAYYDENPNEFKNPEQVKVEYVILSSEKFAAEQVVTDDEAMKFYDERLAKGEFKKKSNETLEEKKAAAGKAQDVLKEVNANPANFAELAKKYSQDAGSAAQGGDLGYFGKGAMVKPFEDAVYSMEVEEIRGPVESAFGYHIIKLTGIKGAERQASHILIAFDEKTQSFAEVKDSLISEQKKQKANKKYLEAAAAFNDMVYEQSDSLKPVVDAFKLTIQQSEFIPRTGVGANPLFTSKKFLDAIFSDEVLKSKRNTEAIEVAPNTLIAARVLEYKPSSTKPFSESRAGILEKLKQKKALELATAQAKTTLDLLNQGKNAPGLNWSPAKLLGRQNPGDVPGDIVAAVFKADVKKLPAFVGSEGPAWYTLIKISKVLDAPPVDDAKHNAIAPRLAQAQ